MQKYPAAAAVHPPVVVPHVTAVVVLLQYPALHVHATRCALPPAHALPAPQMTQLPLVPAHAVDDVEVLTYPAVHVHAAGAAAPPAHEYPAVQALPAAAVLAAGQYAPAAAPHVPEHAVVLNPVALPYVPAGQTVLSFVVPRQ